MKEEYDLVVRENALKTAKSVWLIWAEESEGKLRLFPKQAFLVWGGTRRAFLLDEHANTVRRACAETFDTREHCEAHIAHRAALARADAARSAVIAAARDAASDVTWSGRGTIQRVVQELDSAERAAAKTREVLEAFGPHPGRKRYSTTEAAR